MNGFAERRPASARQQRRRVIALVTGLVVVAGTVAVTRVSSADTAEGVSALAAAARIPNDQGPSPECAGFPARPGKDGTKSATTLGGRHRGHGGKGDTKPPPAEPPAEPDPNEPAPPGEQPPGEQPPAEPPAEPDPNEPAPPGEQPPGEQPPGEQPPGEQPPGEQPPGEEPPGEQPPGEEPPAEEPPAKPDPNQPPANNRPKPPDKCHDDQGGPFTADYVNIRSVIPKIREPQRGRNASTGTFVSRCGRNLNNHRNPDNFIVAPGVSNGAHHTHDYVGNLSADGFSTDESLNAAGTTCARGDKSVYFWPVMRRRGTVGPDANAGGGGLDGNVGRILRPTQVRLEFRGNSKSKVVAAPRFLRVITGDAKSLTNGPANAKALWTCTGFTNRTTTKYPLCPSGSQVQRILDFPGCWDGQNTDSPNHRGHIIHATADGRCPAPTKAVPQLRMILTYQVPRGRSFSLDSFPEQKHNPLTDHGDWANLMPDSLMAFVVSCINRGRQC